ncbi:MAG: hypothetical protein NZ602_04735 [Thermoguttaceae bacterium]|nr:hypothetical protein [Thermoguttaceae bacterium]MDW8037335.1 hypothetical protein [Thermoguttaceae bacterium]
MSAHIRSKWQNRVWLLGSIITVVCLWVAIKTGLAWQLLPGRPAGGQLLAFLAPKAPVQPLPQAPADQANQLPGQKPATSPHHPLIQALLQALEAFHGEGQDAKDALRNRLHQADQELRGLLGGRKEKILQLNRKPVLPLIEEPSPSIPPPEAKKPTTPPGSEPAPASKLVSPQAKPSQPQPKPPLPGGPPAEPTKSAPSTQQPKPVAPPDKPGEVRTALVRALLEVLDKLNDVSEEDRRQVRQLLLEADKDLAKALQPPSVPIPKVPPTAAPSAKP